jgi:type I restriction enzyme S subunit
MVTKMKPSGIEWIGEIPEGWDISKVKYFYETQLGKMLQPSQKNNNETLEKYLCSFNITWDGINQSEIKEMWFSEREKKIFSIKRGDLLVSEGGDAGRACICDIDFPCYIQNAVHRVRARENAINKYLYYWLYVLKAIGYIDLLCNKATIMHFTQDKMLNIDIPIPPIDVQHQIADYLDQKCGDIDKIIFAKHRQNELLKEQRQSIIYEAVTKGLDKNVPYKDSYIEWIGEIPEDWEICKIKYICDIDKNRLSENTDEKFLFNYIDISSITELGGIGETIRMSFKESPSRARMVVSKNDIIISTVRTYLRAIAFITENDKYICSTGFAVLTPKDNLYSKFAFYQVQSEYIVQEIVRRSVGVSYPAITSTALSNISLIIPPLPTQRVMADYLDQKCADIDRIINTNNDMIEKLKEYRQSIVYEAVTGKI